MTTTDANPTGASNLHLVAPQVLTGDKKSPGANANPDFEMPSGLVDEKISPTAFSQLAGSMAGYPFVKIVVDRRDGSIHFINDHIFSYHADYIAEHCLSTPRAEIRKRIDAFNERVYLSPDKDREFLLGLLSLHQRKNDYFYALETVEIDNMGPELIDELYQKTLEYIDGSYPILFKPANHDQEKLVGSMDRKALPRILNHELFATASFIALNEGTTRGRLRVFSTEEQYKAEFDTIEWYDILVMAKVPDGIPRISGIINSHHVTPLSHTNVLAHGWQIPNCVDEKIMHNLLERGLDNKWVCYEVSGKKSSATVKEIERPDDINAVPSWRAHTVKIEEPEIITPDAKSLERLRLSDACRFGTKAANLGELIHVLVRGSSRITGYYRIPRPPRENLLGYLGSQLGTNSSDPEGLRQESEEFLRSNLKVPRGIAIPFALQRQFLESSPAIQQVIGKLKMALELDAKVVDALCIELQGLVRRTRFSDEMRDYIDTQIAMNLGGVTTFVVRSSSNAEDLEDFSAAGIYESINHVTTAANIFDSIKQVWASLVAPRSVRLRQQAGIPLDSSYMGVIVQEEVTSDIGGVMVTCNPMNRSDIRNIYINVSRDSAIEVVEGTKLPMQYLLNTLEGVGRTLSLGTATEDLPEYQKELLARLALAGRLMQSHFSRDYTFSAPIDVEWAIRGNDIYILQLRPYNG